MVTAWWCAEKSDCVAALPGASKFYFQRKKRREKMGACCAKFGTYLLRKEENKVVSNGATPKLNRVEHKQSFVASPEANGRTRSASSSSSSSSSSSGSKS